MKLRTLQIAALVLLATACTARTPADDASVPDQDGRVVIPDAFHADAGVTCAPGTINCDGVCAEVVGDSMNCGSCGNACPSGTSCALGRCDCHAPMLGCGGECVATETNHAHCGTCDHACALNEGCMHGECIVNCALRQASCDGMCVEAQTDPMNCGGCDIRCAEGTVCTMGICTCPGTQISCGGHCIDVDSDPANCGTCINSCGTGGVCTGGVCTTCGPSPAGVALTGCGSPSRCYDTDTSTLHCGACGHACGAGQTCVAGVCGCTAPLESCGTTTCFDFQSAVGHCGDCDTDCGTGGACSSGTCTCASGFTMCGAECADVMTSEEHCGNCTTTCGSGEECRTGVCTPVPTFRILTLGQTGCSVVDHNAESGDDRGGVAVSASTFFVNADDSMVRMSPADLSGITAIGATHDTVFTDVGAEQVYILMTASGSEAGEEDTVTQLAVLDPMTGAITATRIPLSTAIPLSFEVGIFSGWGAAYIAVIDDFEENAQWFHIELPSGAVTRLGATDWFDHSFCETFWTFFGLGERFGGVRYGTYVANDTEIARIPIPETGHSPSAPTPVTTFTNLSDMCSISFSTSRSRWYFHHEGSSQFGGTNETAGFCPATFDRP